MRTCGRRLAARLTSFVGWPAKSALAPGGRILTLKVMQFAPQQDEALKAVSQWLKGGRSQLFRLFGYAGTGKTTLARHFAENVDGEVVFAAFTGKAAQVLRSKGATNAKTIHSLIYRPRGEEEVEDEETGKTSIAPMFAINRQSPVAKAALIIVDECSMVDEALGKDLMSFGTPILVLGDPGQLPPVSGGGYFTNHEPDFLLTDIHRQARDNPIIQLAMQVREGKEIMHGDYGTAQVISKGQVTQPLVLEADQVLVGTNRTRRRYNQRLRELKGFTSEYPQSGDKLVCLRNDPAKGLLNGSLWQVMSSSKETVKPGINLMIRPEDDDMDRGAAKIKLLKAAFEDVEGEIPWSTRKRYDEFDYGYALTVHKAQGSQWNNVVLFDESWAFRDTRERWLYTAITRAAERLTIVR
ncbi:exodeoxyribonuclease-5 [Sinorhizobium meliloti]|uniref:Exodeoxyribonuclease V n=3 Tax=Rhizobium meliloti TaxID=382 RepID=Q92K51_RHIME|nr:exodeoxyribonuclease V [Sinorhizobium meliloti BL225C]AEG53798.1 exodeoxyribonuclease V [Sinorhizobium meliloti AK83]AGA07078.1 PIF1 helicase [Sinorhizobium meliloti GR4]AGG74687.1 Putative exodeoxyribonuclease V [Sinorhizobium meliloti 2011]MBP2466698.1 exodeoxyribonuclease-5 [Sinorhizobium meliloti]TWA90293.1 exodeoxyribonuclease-5 [Ensifer sp. SEMIA 134]TWB27183.1 exodeoxyribonuclease-5 [Ensifer sp. SEMIA 135]CAC46676.1 Exodeoxyribonuclease V [Sinorhizobium meliloti 1021]CCM67964.1 hy